MRDNKNLIKFLENELLEAEKQLEELEKNNDLKKAIIYLLEKQIKINKSSINKQIFKQNYYQKRVA